MNPIEPTIATPRKLIFTINDTSSRDGFVVTCNNRLVESRNSRTFNVLDLQGFGYAPRLFGG
jgi:hypothetical protein